MRRLLAMICCLVLATTLVARGGGVVACAEGRSCCAMPSRFAAMSATTAPTTSPSCCDDDEKPMTAPVSHGHPASHEPHASMPTDIPCCGMVAWTPALADAPSIGDAVVSDAIASFDEPRSIANAEPATPPPRAVG